MSDDLVKYIQSAGVYHCMDCGKCTSVCPISIRNPDFSPRKTVIMAVHGGEQTLIEDELSWNCLTCNMCTTRCPMAVDFIDFIREVRNRSFDSGNKGNCTHGCTIRTWGELMAHDGVQPNRLGWLTEDLKTSEEGEYGYFVGCMPLYSQFFTEFAPDTVEAARNTVRVLNWLGIAPVIMGDEVCCGHDFLWSGDERTFGDLAARNIEAIKKHGIQKMIISCAECYRTLKIDYPKVDENYSLEIAHTSEFFLEKIERGSLKISSKGNGTVTFHDPCRLSKHMGITDSPRELLKRIEGLELREMPRSGSRSVCCGTSLWMNCSWISKDMQVERLKEAKATGSHAMLTACPKCMIHFRCAQSENDTDEETRIEVKDISTLLAESIKEK
jgi:Fe-S oxidoreductase